MRASQLYSPTLREMPADAEVMSHKLMLRAGFIRKLSAGLYTFLPLAWRTLRKIETIVRGNGRYRFAGNYDADYSAGRNLAGIGTLGRLR